MAPKHKSVDASNSDMPKESHEVLTSSEKNESSQLNRGRKNCMLRYAKT